MVVSMDISRTWVSPVTADTLKELCLTILIAETVLGMAIGLWKACHGLKLLTTTTVRCRRPSLPTTEVRRQSEIGLSPSIQEEMIIVNG